MKNIFTKLKEKIKGLSKVTIAMLVTLMCVCTFGIVKATVTMDYDNNQMIYQTGDTQELPTPVWGGSSGPNPYKDKVLSVNTLYDVGEANLTADDIVQVNGIDCYVLQVDETNNKAELITKGIYDARFDSTGSTYKYHESPLKTWMDDFYTNQLDSDSYILESDVISYFSDNFDDDPTTLSLKQHVFVPDAMEVMMTDEKFIWDPDAEIPYEAFWLSGGGYDSEDGSLLGYIMTCVGWANVYYVDSEAVGARPAFWLDISESPQMEFAGWWTKDGTQDGDWGTQVTTISATDMGDMDLYAKWEEKASSNPYATKVASVQKLYDVGEANLTADDIVQVNGIDCYVLQVDEVNNKAKLITKGIYDVRFDEDGSTYKYHESSLKTWMDNFYTNQLGSDEYILESNVTSYYTSGYSVDLDTCSTESLSQHVFALDAKEFIYAEDWYIFSWNYEDGFIDNPSAYAAGFWVSAGFDYYNTSVASIVYYEGRTSNTDIEYANVGARPAFWISLD